MQSKRIIHNAIEKNLQSTGLFINWKKRDLLIVNVEPLLREQCNTTAVCGEPRGDGTCEILLQALDKSGAKFADSKDLLVSFLNMTKEAKSCTPLADSKQPEVIDLSDDDTVTCIVLDDTTEILDVSSPQVPSFSCWKRKWSEIDEDIVIIDSEEQNHAQVRGNEHSCPEIKEVNGRSSKRKRICGTVDTNIEVITCQDDEIIVLDDSFSFPSADPNCEMSSASCNRPDVTITLDGENRLASDRLSGAGINIENNNATDLARINDCGKQDVCIESLTTVSSKNTEVMEENSSKSPSDENATSNTKKRKNSKLAYKRLPHLTKALIQNHSSDGKVMKVTTPSNIYNPYSNSTEQKSGLRPIVIDGNNIAVSHGNGRFSIKGVQMCINYFEKRGHRQIKAFLPHYRKNPETYAIINQMEKQGTVVITPSRKIDGKMCASYDDRFIVQYASEVEGIIVSTDNFRDLLEENPNWSDTIKNRLLMFTWVDDLLMFPQDPLGREGPTLDKFFKF